VSPTPLAFAQDGIVPATLLCFDTMAGDGPVPTAGVPTRLRLFVSPVKPSITQLGAFVVPLCTVVLTTIVDPALKLACDEQLSPTVMNSTPFHPEARFNSLSLFAALAGPPAVVTKTESVPPALASPPSFKLARFVTGCTLTEVALVAFFQQSLPPLEASGYVFHPAGHVVLYPSSQY
jgi:hypothetical protein